MQTLDISASHPESESRLKSLFWPSVRSASDVDYLGTQGYWVCALVAVFSAVGNAIQGTPVASIFILLFFYFGGVGVREHSRYASAVVLVLFVADTVLAGPGVVSVLLAALLLSNVRATWIAAGWKPDSAEAIPPPRLRETWGDKFADSLPSILWPKVRIVYYVYSAGFLALVALGTTMMVLHRARH